MLSLRFNHFCIFSYLSVQDKPVIEENHCVFSDNSGRNVVENDPNYVLDDHPIVWTNFVGFTKVETKMTAKYLQPADNRDPQHYVTGFRVGVIEERVTLYYYKGLKCSHTILAYNMNRKA